MNTALLLITLVSVGTTAAVLVYAMRLIREERERSEARVIALSDAIAQSMPRAGSFAAAELGEAMPARQGWSPRAAEPASFRAGESSSHGHSTQAGQPISTEAAKSRNETRGVRIATAGDLRIAPREAFDDTEPTVSPLLFGGGEPDTSRSRTWLLAPVAGALVVLALIGGVYATSSSSSATSASTPAVANAGSGPLELISLRHVRKGNELTISGLVRNPPGGRPQAKVMALVFLFDRSGSFITSGRAPLDYQQLAAGAESPFVVTVPNAGAVTRYRVSFRTERDVVPHVDRRAGVENLKN